ncbi:MAG TPA: carboxypeptidase-like regulatory domain-containing protein [Pyrinomonadaceae bacterium]|jgi:hypothetical protein
MRKALQVSLTLLAVCALFGASAPQALAAGGGGSRTLGTIAGTVRDNKGNPLAGAVISLLKEGAGEVIKQTRSSSDGSFSTKISPGRYSVKAVAEGFNEILFSAVQVRASDEIIYRFNLEPTGQGRTAPEMRRDRDNVRWRLKAAQGRRSIFQIQEGDDQAIREALGIEAEETGPAADEVADAGEAQTGHNAPRIHGVIETYAAASASSFAPGYIGTNFAISAPAGQQAELIFAGQLGAGEGAPQRLETSARVRAGDHHRLNFSVGANRLGSAAVLNKAANNSPLGQLSLRAIDEWVVRDSIVVVLGLDYSRFLGASNAATINPRFGFQFDADARTRLRAAYVPGGEEQRVQSVADFEDGQVTFKQPMQTPVALVDGRAVMERSRRFEFGVERVLDNESSIEATAFFDTTSNRGVGLLSTPLSGFANENGEALISVANQQGAARGMRVVYTRRVSRVLSASAGYSFGRGQRLSNEGINNPSELFQNGFFQTAALQMGADFGSGTRVHTIFRFSPKATVFAIDPFAGRLAVYDPSLSILVTQDLPSFGLPVRAEAVLDARNLLDTQTSAEDGETVLTVGSGARRSVRGGISVRF